jgi:RNA polymerase sigma-70 factor (ECF subfamily)
VSIILQNDRSRGRITLPRAPATGNESLAAASKRQMKPQSAAQLAVRQKQFLSFLQQRLGDRAAAEDVLQAAYLRATEKADTIRDEESSVAWFYRLLRNAVADVRRGAAREERALTGGKLAPDEEEPALNTAVCHCVSALAETLKPSHARLLRRVDLDGASVSEVAREEGITPNNAAVRLHRARAALRDKLKLACGACARHGCLDCGCPRRTAL